MPQEEDISTERLAVRFANGAEFASLSALRSAWRSCWDTLGTQALTAGLGVISGLLLPRLLGPQGRGELAAVTLWPITLVFLGSLSLDRAAVFFSSKHRQDVSPVATACLAIGGAQALFVVLIGTLVIPFALRSYGSPTVRVGMFFLFCAPLVQASSLQGNLLLGHLETRWYNACRMIPPFVYAVGVAILFTRKAPSIPAVVALQALGLALAAIAACYVLRAKLRPSWQWDFPLIKRMLTYGLTSHIGEITYFMNQRLDQLLISLFLPSANLGIYVAAVAFTDGLLIVPRGIGAVTLAAGSNSDAAGAWRWTMRSLLLTALWLAPAAIALWFLSPAVIPFLFGARFSPSVLPCRILILGTCASGLNTVLAEAARSINRPEIPSYAELIGFIVTAALLAMLLKPYGPVGAAIASSIAYAAVLSTNFYFIIRSQLISRMNVYSLARTSGKG